MTAPCSDTWTDHVLPYTHHCGLDEGHPGPHVCAACTQTPGGANPPAPRPELVTEECGPFWEHEDCDDPGCTCHCHGSELSDSERSTTNA